MLRSRFVAVRVRPAHRDYKRTEPHPGRMASGRVAKERIGTDQILAFHLAGRKFIAVAGEDGETPLDY